MHEILSKHWTLYSLIKVNLISFYVERIASFTEAAYITLEDRMFQIND